MQPHVSRTLAIRTLTFTAILLFQVLSVTSAEPAQFVRGDANADGFLSTADILTIQRWLFAGDDPPSCIDSADLDDNGRVDLCDAIGVAVYLFAMGGCSHDNTPVDYGVTPPAPFPSLGEDPTADTEPYMSCNGFTVTAPESTDDVIRLGDVETNGSSEIAVPVFVANARSVEAVQLVLKYDPALVQIGASATTITYEGTYYEQFRDKVFLIPGGFFTYGAPFTFVQNHPEDGIFTASIVPDLLARGPFQVPAGTETLVARIKLTVSPDLPAGSLVHLDPQDGLDGQGYGRFRLHNELTYKGDGRYPTVAPRKIGGVLRIGVDGDISFFIRGDANGDNRVDVSDAIFTLGFLFLGDDEPSCLDAVDTDDDGILVITDAIAILSELFLGEHSIAAPFPEAGPDARPDFLKQCGKGE